MEISWYELYVVCTVHGTLLHTRSTVHVAARIVTCQRRSCHTTPILHEETPLAPGDLQNAVQRATTRVPCLEWSGPRIPCKHYVQPRHLRSTERLLLTMPRTKHRCMGRAPSIGSFEKRLKTVLFTRAFADCSYKHLA